MIDRQLVNLVFLVTLLIGCESDREKHEKQFNYYIGKLETVSTLDTFYKNQFSHSINGDDLEQLGKEIDKCFVGDTNYLGYYIFKIGQKPVCSQGFSSWQFTDFYTDLKLWKGINHFYIGDLYRSEVERPINTMTINTSLRPNESNTICIKRSINYYIFEVFVFFNTELPINRENRRLNFAR